ncbi:MAG: hypothetical protein VKO21_09100 [Candidatus Sericytochromatia bacterium]|nr:hypothetical protein [Candidatus Sericytochromatia bacterium]
MKDLSSGFRATSLTRALGTTGKLQGPASGVAGGPALKGPSDGLNAPKANADAMGISKTATESLKPFEVLAKDPSMGGLVARFKDLKDEAGRTVQQHLERLLALPDHVLKGTKAFDLACQVLKDLQSPERIYQGENTTSCTVTNVQSLLARQLPAEYVRMVADLASTGEYGTREGDVIRADWRGFSRDEGRNGVADLIQESLMSFAEVRFPKDAGTELGRKAYKAVMRWGKELGILQDSGEPPAEDRALTAQQLVKLTESLTGNASLPSPLRKGFANSTEQTGYRKAMERVVIDAVKTSGPVQFGVAGSREEDMGHLMSIQSIRLGHGSGPIANVYDPANAAVGVQAVPLSSLLDDAAMVILSPKHLLDVENIEKGIAQKREENARRAFAAQDKNKDGVLEGDEIRPEQRGWTRLDGAHAVFRESNSQITPEEFAMGQQLEADKSPEQKKREAEELKKQLALEKAFAAQDKNKDGVLEGDEIRPEQRGWAGLDGSTWRGDGSQITPEEFAMGREDRSS